MAEDRGAAEDSGRKGDLSSAAYVGALCGSCLCAAITALGTACWVAWQLRPAGLAGPPVQLFEVASGFAWAENLACVPMKDDRQHAALFVTDMRRGDLFRVHARPDGVYEAPVLHPMSSAFALLAGITYDRRADVLYVLGNRLGSPLCEVVRVDAFGAGFETVATLPVVCMGDGIAVHEDSGHLFVASQGGLAPGQGKVFRVDPASGTTTALLEGMAAADGAFVDQERSLLFITALLADDEPILVFDASNGTLLRRLGVHGAAVLDDVVVPEGSEQLLAADFGAQAVVEMSLEPEAGTPASARMVAGGMTTPTSVRFGCVSARDSPFSDQLLFMTEGGGESSLVSNRRVLAFRRPPGASALLPPDGDAR